ncbi:MAG: glycosyltransferase, partial [Candidatus Hinthialibacter sp.]
HLGRKLKRLGRLTILRETVATSPRKLHQFTLREHLLFFMSGILLPWKVLRDRKYLDIWYTRRG